MMKGNCRGGVKICTLFFFGMKIRSYILISDCISRTVSIANFDILLTVHLSIILEINELNAQNLLL